MSGEWTVVPVELDKTAHINQTDQTDLDGRK
jgi:hypothetical protein